MKLLFFSIALYFPPLSCYLHHCYRVAPLVFSLSPLNESLFYHQCLFPDFHSQSNKIITTHFITPTSFLFIYWPDINLYYLLSSFWFDTVHKFLSRLLRHFWKKHHFCICSFLLVLLLQVLSNSCIFAQVQM